MLKESIARITVIEDKETSDCGDIDHGPTIKNVPLFQSKPSVFCLKVSPNCLAAGKITSFNSFPSKRNIVFGVKNEQLVVSPCVHQDIKYSNDSCSINLNHKELETIRTTDWTDIDECSHRSKFSMNSSNYSIKLPINFAKSPKGGFSSIMATTPTGLSIHKEKPLQSGKTLTTSNILRGKFSLKPTAPVTASAGSRTPATCILQEQNANNNTLRTMSAKPKRKVSFSTKKQVIIYDQNKPITPRCTNTNTH